MKRKKPYKRRSSYWNYISFKSKRGAARKDDDDIKMSRFSVKDGREYFLYEEKSKLWLSNYAIPSKFSVGYKEPKKFYMSSFENSRRRFSGRIVKEFLLNFGSSGAWRPILVPKKNKG